jgi:hypothetical protein
VILVRVTTAATLLAIDQSVVCHASVSLACVGSTVSPFSSEYAALPDIPVEMVMTVYDDPRDGQSYLLVVHEALYFGDRMSHSLICPNQL